MQPTAQAVGKGMCETSPSGAKDISNASSCPPPAPS